MSDSETTYNALNRERIREYKREWAKKNKDKIKLFISDNTNYLKIICDEKNIMILNKKKIIFETARKITAHQKKILEGIAKSGDLIKEKINPELIAGIKIIINNNRQFDGSMKSKLQNIF